MPPSLTMVMLPPENDVTREWAERLARDVPGIRVLLAKDETGREILRADAAYGSITANALARALQLRWVHLPPMAPAESYYRDAVAERPLIFTRSDVVDNDDINTHLMALILALAQGLHRFARESSSRSRVGTPGQQDAIDLVGATVLMVGLGGSALDAAPLCQAFGMSVLGIDTRRRTALPGVDLHSFGDLESLLPQADFVVVRVPDTPTTKGLFSRAQFRQMRPSAYLINVGGSKVVQLEDLVAALQAGEIAGAGLDVFDEEALPTSHPLWSFPNVIVTPHVAGAGANLKERHYRLIRDNCRALVEGRPLTGVVLGGPR